MNFSTLLVKLKGDISDFANKMKQAAAVANSTAESINSGLNRAANKSKFEFKDVARIVQGIMISKAFYGGLNAIRNCTDAVMDFSQQLEYAHMAYTNLFSDSQLATEFINVLKDFSATTPFDFTESEAAAKRLLAYGIEYKNVMYVMQGIMSASAAQNNPAIIESVSRAMGQIYTKGRLMNEEMRQLAEAGIPAYDILKEKLGLTQEQLQNLGKQSIPASQAINALIDGMNERFSGVVANSTKTLPGILNNIKDNATMIASGVFDPLYQKIKKVAAAFGDFLMQLRNIYELEGLGGIFERLVPPELQLQVRMLAANLMNLWTVLKLYLHDAFEICKSAAYALLMVFNAFAPVITIVLDVIGQLIHHLTSNTVVMRLLTASIAAAAAMWVVFKIKAIGAMVAATVAKVISKAFLALNTVLSLVVAHPIWALLLTVGAVLVGLSGGFNKLGKSIQNMFSKLSGLNGVDPNKLFMKENKKRENDLSKFNKRLDTTADNMDKVGDSSTKAGKKAKKAANDVKKAIEGLLSFDEVFKLKDPDETTNTKTDTPDTNLGDIGDIGDIGGIGDLGDSLVPEVPDFGSVATDFVNKFIGTLKDKFLDAGIGAILGAILGGILGGPLGAKIGMIAGAIAGWFWDDICKALGLGDVGKVAVPIATVLGAAVGSLMGNPIMGAAIGTMVGFLIDGIAHGIETGDWSKIWTPLGGMIGTAIGYALGGPIGAFAGGAIGLAIGKFMNLFWDEMAKDMGLTDPGKLALPLSTVIGSALGLAVGGPHGAIIGAGVGALVGWLIDGIARGLETGDWSNVVMPIGTGLGAAIGALVGQPVLGAAVGTVIGWIANKFIEGFQSGDFDWTSISMGIGQLLGAAIGGIVGGPAGAAIGSIIGTVVGWIAGKFLEADWSKVVDAFKQPFIEFGNAVSDLFNTIWQPIKDAFDNGDWASLGLNIVLGIVKGIVGAIGTVIAAIGTFFAAVIAGFCEIFGINSPAETTKPIGENIIYGVLEGFKNAFVSVLSWIASAGIQVITGIGNWFTSVGSTIASWATDSFSTISSWTTNAASSISKWASNTASSVSTWASNTSARVSTWASNTSTKISNWVTSNVNKFSNWSTNLINRVSTWASTSSNKISSFVTTSTQKFTTFVSTSTNKFANFVSNTTSKISNWSSNMKSKASTAMNNFNTQVSTGLTNALGKVRSFCSNALSAISSWASSFGRTISNAISSASTALSNFASRAASAASSAASAASSYLPGHATGGVFNREHVARFAEGNRAEAVIPLQNQSAMQPFVDAVSDGITQTLAPLLASNKGNAYGSDEALRPLYVGTLIADERGLKELNRRMQIIQIKEDGRKG